MIKIQSTINCLLLILPIIFIASYQIQLVQGRPFVLSIPLITVDKIKNFFSSLTNGIKEGNTINPPSVNRLTDSCHKSFTMELDLNSSSTINPLIDGGDDQQLIDLSSPYFLYSSDNQTIIFNHVWIKVRQGNSPCPLDESVCDLIPAIVTKDAPMNWVIANLLGTYWESCMQMANELTNETSVDHQ